MTKGRPPPRWVAAFLRALRRTANVRAAVRMAGVDASTAYLRRKSHPEFAARWQAAVAKGRVRAAIEPGRQRRTARSYPDPREFILRVSKKAGAQLVRAGEGRWSGAAEKAFFAHLAATGNIGASAEAAGVSREAVYARRQNYPGFHAKWQAALEQGCARVDMMLIHAATATFDPEATPPPDAMPKVTVAEAINILKLHRDNRTGGPGRGNRYGPREPSIEQVRANILRKLDAIEAHERRGQPDA